LFFDREMNFKNGGFVQMSEAGLEDGTNKAHEKLSQEFIAEEPGYVYIYLSNDGSVGSGEVFFDDFSIMSSESYIVQTIDYYPYGLVASNWVRQGEKATKDLFQGKTYEELTQWSDFHARQYDAAVGRWFGVDPQGQFASPYVGMGNNPVMMVDPDGELAFLAVVGIVAVVSGGINLGIAASQGKVNNFWDGAYYFGVGAAVGAGATIGGAALAPVIGTGAIAGGILGAGSGFTLGFANTAYDTKGDWKASFLDAGRGALIGGIGGALIGGTIAGVKGNNIWTGAPKVPGTSSFSFKWEDGPSWKFGDAERLTKDFWKFGYNPKTNIELGPPELTPDQPKDGWNRNYTSKSHSYSNGKVVTNPDGSKVILDIPSNYGVRPANNGNGWVYQAPGSTGNANMIRVMGPTSYAPKGYVVFYNSYGQAYNPGTGKTLSPDLWHFLFK
ncbi:MAG: hypothetical protein M3512_18795, partial [Bacteroidota bacterium]|nr:hypothetical protein [Bacteroidota bacterium]MDQ3535721.1 hypothetical protein [Bacteroidota bacterium]